MKNIILKINYNLEKLFILFLLIICVISIILKMDYIYIFLIGSVILICLFVLIKNNNVLMGAAIITTLIQGFLIEELYMPKYIKYIPDMLIIFILIKCIYKYFVLKEKMKKTNIEKIIFLMIVIQFVSFVLNNYSIIKYLWAVKNWYRYMIIMWGFYYLGISINKKFIFKIIKIILAVQVVTTIYEFLTPGKIILDNQNDRVSGLFGNRGTGIAIILLLMLFSFVLSRYIHEEDKNIKNVAELLFIMFLQFVLGEVRAGFFLTPIIVFIIFAVGIINKVEKKYLKKFAAMFVIIIFSILIGFSLYVKQYKNFSGIRELYSFEYLEKTLYKGSYTSDGKMINRLNGPKIVTNLILNKPSKFLLGVGLGNGAPIENKALTGEYFKRYGYLNYHFFFIPYYLIENGYLGFSILMSLILYVLYKCHKAYRAINKNRKWIILGYEGCIFVILFTLLYNAAFGELQVGVVFWGVTGIVLRIINYSNYEELS